MRLKTIGFTLVLGLVAIAGTVEAQQQTNIKKNFTWTFGGTQAAGINVDATHGAFANGAFARIDFTELGGGAGHFMNLPLSTKVLPPGGSIGVSETGLNPGALKKNTAYKCQVWVRKKNTTYYYDDAVFHIDGVGNVVLGPLPNGGNGGGMGG